MLYKTVRNVYKVSQKYAHTLYNLLRVKGENETQDTFLEIKSKTFSNN